MGYARPTLTQGSAAAVGVGNATLADVAGTASWSLVPDGSTVHYAIQDAPPDARYEWGLGTKATAGGSPVLQRLAANVLGGSAGAGALVNFTGPYQLVYAAPLGEAEVLPSVTADPAVASPGQLTYRTDTGQVRAYAGGAWASLVRTDTLPASVSSFNTRQGAVTLSGADVTAALAYAPVPPSRQVLAGAGLSGGGDLSADRTLSLPATGTPGAYGDATHFVGITTDAQGRVTAVTAFALPAPGVATFNGRAGAVTLSSADVDAALPADVAVTGAANTFTAGPQRISVAPGMGGFSDPTGGTSNERFGAGAMNAAGLTGDYNTAVGKSALGAAAAGGFNVAVGAQAMLSTTTGSNNVAVGMNALELNTSGSSNVALGGPALQFNTTGSNNVAIGSGALNANTVGNYQVAVGYVALGANTTGYGNAAVGYAALGACTSGGANAALGASALQSMTTGTNNVGVGYGSLMSATTGSNNVAVGSGSGAGVAAGGFNALLGYGTGTAGDASNGVAVGYGAACGQSGVALGYAAVAAANEAAFGPHVNYVSAYGYSSTSAVRPRFDLTAANVDNTDATRKYRVVLNAWDTAAREVVRGEADGAAARVGFLGASAIARRTVNAACTDLPTAVALANQLRQLMIDLGLAQ